MANLNKVMLMGNITRDPELKYMPNQTAVCDFGLAVNRTWTGQDGVKKEEVTFVDCTCFAKTAEILTKYKKKGDPLFIEGRLKLDTWEAQDGGKRSKLRVIVENFQFLNRAAPGGPGSGGGHGYDGGEEYSGEPTNSGGGYNQQPRGNYNNAPRPAGPGPGPSGGQQRYNQGGRPAGPQQQRSAPAPQAAPDYDAPDAPSPDDTPPIANDDIPF